MAITKILPVRGQLKGCLDYAANPQKTEYLNTADMQRLMNYTQNGDTALFSELAHKYGVSPLPAIMSDAKRFDVFFTTNMSVSRNSPHLTALSFSLSEAFIFPGGHPPGSDFSKDLILPMPDNRSRFS